MSGLQISTELRNSCLGISTELRNSLPNPPTKREIFEARKRSYDKNVCALRRIDLKTAVYECNAMLEALKTDYSKNHIIYRFHVDESSDIPIQLYDYYRQFDFSSVKWHVKMEFAGWMCELEICI